MAAQYTRPHQKEQIPDAQILCDLGGGACGGGVSVRREQSPLLPMSLQKSFGCEESKEAGNVSLKDTLIGTKFRQVERTDRRY